MGKQLAELEDVTVFMDDIQISMVFFKIEKKEIDYDALVTYFADAGILINSHENGIMRFVTNHDVSKEDARTAVAKLHDFIKNH